MATITHNFTSTLNIFFLLLLIKSYDIHAQDISPSPSPSPSPTQLISQLLSLSLCPFESSPDLTWLSSKQNWQMKTTPNNDPFLIKVAKFAVEEHNKCGTYEVKYDKTILLEFQRFTMATVYRLLIRGITSDPRYGYLYYTVVNYHHNFDKLAIFLWQPIFSIDIPYYETLCGFNNAFDSTYELPGEWVAKTKPNGDSLLVDIAMFVIDQINQRPCKWFDFALGPNHDNGLAPVPDGVAPVSYGLAPVPEHLSMDRDDSMLSIYDDFKDHKIDSCDYQEFVNGDKLFRCIISTKPTFLSPSTFQSKSQSYKIKSVVYWEPSENRKTLIYFKSSFD